MTTPLPTPLFEPLDIDGYDKGVWCVYMIETEDGSLYTGITNHLPSRWRAHCAGKGARYFRTRTPRHVAFVEVAEDRASASRREAQIKSLSRQQKVKLVTGHHDGPVVQR